MSTRYERIGYLGEGQFATVYRAQDTVIDRIVAVKKIKAGSRSEVRDGINRTALREIKLLQELNHENVISLLDVYGKKSSICLVFDYMETDLEVVIKDTSIILSPAHIKSYILMTLKGLEYLHDNWILHRDLKPNNLLLDSKNVLKIADFGLARSYGSPTRVYTNQVVTRWYRAPELLFGARMYGTGIDVWALGCILAELFLRSPFLTGNSDIDQMDKVVSVVGSPDENNWPGVNNLPDYVFFKQSPGIPFKDIFTAVGDDALELLSSMLKLYPLHRCTCSQALSMAYFRNKPFATPTDQLPSPKDKNTSSDDDEGLAKGRKRPFSQDTMSGSVTTGLATSAKRLNFD